MPTFQLREWQTRELRLPRRVVTGLIQRHGSHLVIRPTQDDPDVWEVRPQSTVGSLVVDDHRFLIRPKVGLPNLLAMMDVPIASEAITREEVELAAAEDFLVALVRLFCVATESTTRRGIRRDYLRMEERLVSPRGRIDVRAMARNPGVDLPVPCVFDEHTADVMLNRVLRTAVDFCLRVPGVPPVYRRRLMLQQQELADVDDRCDLEWARAWEPAPMERHYRASIRLARWILESGSVTHSAGDQTSPTFLLDMNYLFEAFVTNELRVSLPQLIVEGQATGIRLGRHGRVKMRPDILVREGSVVLAVADCKYKVLDDELARTPDYYQALAYATALGLDDSWLIYTRGPSDPTLAEVSVRNSPITLRTVSVDLSRPIGVVRRDLSAIAGEITATSRMLRAPHQHERNPGGGGPDTADHDRRAVPGARARVRQDAEETAAMPL